MGQCGDGQIDAGGVLEARRHKRCRRTKAQGRGDGLACPRPAEAQSRRNR